MKSAGRADLEPALAAPTLTRLVGWAQGMVGEVLRPGDLAVDLTAGTGRDTLFLYRRVGSAGRVLAIDIQEEAVRRTANLLREAGAHVFFRSHGTVEFPPGVHLVTGSHELLDRCLPASSPRAIMMNLGYLPGGDPAIRTFPSTTAPAIAHGCRLLQAGGRIAVTVYVGHDGGWEEGEAVAGFFAALPPREWDVLRLQIPNRPASPWLVVAEKRGRPG